MFLKVRFLLLAVMLEKFSEAQSVTCTYTVIEGVYTCRLFAQRIVNVDQMREIRGVHLDGYSDVNVTRLDAGFSTVDIFPSPIIDYFVNLEEVLLGINSMHLTFPIQIQQCQALNYVMINHCGVTEIPAGIFQNCANLRTLDLDFNRITTISPNAFSGLSGLENLRLFRNSIESLDSQVFAPLINLKILDLEFNSISTIDPQAFATMTKLTSLSLGFNNITILDDSLLLHNSELMTLDLSFNKITNITAKSFASLSKLESLNISSNIFIFEIPVLEGLTSLQTLRLVQTTLRSVSTDSFRFMQNLTMLDLENNWISTVDFQSRSTHSLSALQELILRNNRINNLQGQAFSGLTNISRLILSFNSLERLEANSLPTATLRHLDLGNNRITRIDRQLLVNASNLELIMSSNVCYDSTLTIGNGINNATETLLRACFNSAASLTVNIFILIAAVVLLLF